MTRFRLIIQEPTESTTGDAAERSWSDLMSVRCELEKREGGREQNRAGNMEAVQYRRWVIPYCANVKPEMRALFDNRSRVFNIVRVTNRDERSRQLILDCVEQYST